ncbi:MAG TPA: TraR/DksA C4-type zinc finger protein [Methylomirabilota bacterium]|jgi:DnaK suppressor protein|nr:TraR/DksA C4-type zinc finger protein [Methylomirabilota bacterium]
MDHIRERLERERDRAIERLREMGISPHLDESATAAEATADIGRDEGDVAQASERQDLSFMTRERLAERVNQLSAALRRLHEGDYGRCERCGRPIESARLAALPEATTCRACQEDLEREAAGKAA